MKSLLRGASNRSKSDRSPVFFFSSPCFITPYNLPLMKKTFSVQSIFFDLDFTLWDPRVLYPDLVLRSMAQWRKESGIDLPNPDPQAVLDQYGEPAEPYYSAYFPDGHKHHWREVMKIHGRLEIEMIASGHVRETPGARAAIQGLHGRGFRLGVASNCGVPYLEATLAAIGVRQFIDEAVCLGSWGAKNKVELVARLIEKLGKPALMVGDRYNDIDAGHTNGIYAVGVATGLRGREELGNAELIIDTLDQLGGVVDIIKKKVVSDQKPTAFSSPIRPL
jgi:phosphoglycolate phosphatase-like HAD superfamily hydrolase